MKRIMMLAMTLVMLLISIGGCWPWWDEGRGGRDGGYDRGGTHGGPRDSEGPGGPEGGGPGGGH